jgi:hypothetical protein
MVNSAQAGVMSTCWILFDECSGVCVLRIDLDELGFFHLGLIGTSGIFIFYLL